MRFKFASFLLIKRCVTKIKIKSKMSKFQGFLNWTFSNQNIQTVLILPTCILLMIMFVMIYFNVFLGLLYYINLCSSSVLVSFKEIVFIPGYKALSLRFWNVDWKVFLKFSFSVIKVGWLCVYICAHMCECLCQKDICIDTWRINT